MDHMHVVVKINLLQETAAHFLCKRIHFQLYGSDGTTEIGAIHKKYRGFIAEAMTTADTFAIRSIIETIWSHIDLIYFILSSTFGYGCKNESCGARCIIFNRNVHLCVLS